MWAPHKSNWTNVGLDFSNLISIWANRKRVGSRGLLFLGFDAQRPVGPSGGPFCWASLEFGSHLGGRVGRSFRVKSSPTTYTQLHLDRILTVLFWALLWGLLWGLLFGLS